MTIFFVGTATEDTPSLPVSDQQRPTSLNLETNLNKKNWRNNHFRLL
jgi:hypothetical protein